VDKMTSIETMLEIYNIPKELHAEETAKDQLLIYTRQIAGFYHLCMKEMRKFSFPCVVDTTDIHPSVMVMMKTKLEASGYTVVLGDHLFVIDNPYLDKTLVSKLYNI